MYGIGCSPRHSQNWTCDRADTGSSNGQLWAGSPQPKDVLERTMAADEASLAAGNPEARPERERRLPARFTD